MSKIYRHIYFDAAEELVKFNYMRPPNVMLVFNEFGDLVDSVVLAGKEETDESSTSF